MPQLQTLKNGSRPSISGFGWQLIKSTALRRDPALAAIAELLQGFDSADSAALPNLDKRGSTLSFTRSSARMRWLLHKRVASHAVQVALTRC